MSLSIINQLESLSKLSWLILITSLLIETSNVRTFPSYNSIIGVFGISFKWKIVPRDTILLAITCFSTLTIVSIVLDIVYSSLWGSDILQGLSKSTKFSFILLLLNALMKILTLFYIFSAQITLSLSKDFDLQSKLEISRSNIDSDISLDDDDSDEDKHSNLSEESSHQSKVRTKKSTVQMITMTPTAIPRDYDSNAGDTIEPDVEMNRAPFSPGIPGLVSPMHPRRLSHGWTPPRRNT